MTDPILTPEVYGPDHANHSGLAAAKAAMDASRRLSRSGMAQNTTQASSQTSASPPCGDRRCTTLTCPAIVGGPSTT